MGRLRNEGGQSLILIAFAFVGLLAFVGLATDVLLIIDGQSKLVRAVDAAALGAASIYQGGVTPALLDAMAKEFAQLNRVDGNGVAIDTCLSDPGLCPRGEMRRLVRVRAQKAVPLAFLRILGLNNVTLRAEAVAERASLDVTLVIDTSESMARDTDFGAPGPDDCDGNGPTPNDIRDVDCDGLADYNPMECGPSDQCQPMRTVKDAAIAFLGRLEEPFDRAAVISFDQEGQVQQPMTSDLTADMSVVDNLVIYRPPPCNPYPPDPSACTSTCIGCGLVLGNNEFSRPPVREDALWVILLLTDGAANSSDRMGPGNHQWPNVFCPPGTWSPPFCRDPSSASRHPIGNPAYDADDYARDRADFVGLSPPAGNGIPVFTIGLGDLVISAPEGDPDAGERLLRYVAAVSDDGVLSTDPCTGVGRGISCGNYFFSPTAADLDGIFQQIADELFTRLTL